MIIGTGHLKTLEYWAAKQERIFPDACDAGLWAKRDSKLYGIIGKALRGLRETYHSNVSEWGREFQRGQTFRLFVPFEMDDNDYVGCVVQVSFCPTRRSSYISITIDHSTWSQAKLRIGVDADTPFKGIEN